MCMRFQGLQVGIQQGLQSSRVVFRSSQFSLVLTRLQVRIQQECLVQSSRAVFRSYQFSLVLTRLQVEIYSRNVWSSPPEQCSDHPSSPWFSPDSRQKYIVEMSGHFFQSSVQIILVLLTRLHTLHKYTSKGFSLTVHQVNLDLKIAKFWSPYHLFGVYSTLIQLFL